MTYSNIYGGGVLSEKRLPELITAHRAEAAFDAA